MLNCYLQGYTSRIEPRPIPQLAYPQPVSSIDSFAYEPRVYADGDLLKPKKKSKGFELSIQSMTP